MELPDVTLYKDITRRSQARGFSRSTASACLEQHDASLSSGSKLYQERFLRYVRCTEVDGCGLFMGQCRAEMKRSVTYIVHLKLDAEGEVEETQCECAADMGPSACCKHVQAIMLAVIDLSEGKEATVELTCTEQLQSFHRPKKLHQGSPVKAEDLHILNKPNAAVYDPRPAKFRKMSGYPDFIKNSAFNFCSQTGCRIPLLQTIQPANMYALNHDHDYFTKSPADHFLDEMNITLITPETAKAIERRTVNHGPQWKRERQNRIQSSMFGRVIGTVSDKAKQNLAVELIEGRYFKSKYTLHGQQYEPVAIRNYEQMQGVQVKPCGIVVCMDKPYLGSTPDGLVGDDIVVEVKCPYTARNKLVTPQTVPYLVQNGQELNLSPSHDYYAQVQGQMYATGRKMCHFVVHTLVPDTKIINVKYDHDFTTRMISKLDIFFTNHFKPNYLKRHFFNDH